MKGGIVVAALLLARPLVVQVGQWERFEASVTNGKSYANKYNDVTLNVTYTRPDGTTVAFWGFHDGGTTWKTRFMPDQLGTWSYSAAFSDGTAGTSGTFDCVASTVPGMLSKDATNPRWFGFKGGRHVLVRSFHVGDRFFAKNWDDPANAADGNKRKAFLDWAQQQGYNMLSVASHYLNRNASGRGAGWDTPDLWPLNAAEWRELEVILNDLASRRVMVYPFAGFFGRSSDHPTDAANQSRYVRYGLARLGPYWNVLLNVAGPEPNLDGYLSSADVNRLGAEIKNNDRFGHPLSVHNATGDDPYRDSSWSSYGTLQGPKTTSRSTLSSTLLRNHHASKPLYAQETLWPGNQHHPAYTDADIRKNAYVINMSATALNFADMSGNSSSGFSGSMDLAQRRQIWHDVVKRVWDFFDSVPFYRMSPRQDLVSGGFCLAEVGQRYLVYLTGRGSVSVTVASGTYAVQWVNAQNTADKRSGGTTTTAQNLASPADGDDWLLHLTRAAGTNQPPAVNAGPDQTVVLPNSAALDGTVTDDGPVTSSWSKASGPGTVTFGNAAAVDTTASFSAAGTYVLRLAASDGALSAGDDVAITVTSSSGTAQAVTSFTLINADTDQPIAAHDPLSDGAVLNLAALPTRNLNVRANTSPAAVGSVKFGYDANAGYRIENGAPYALAGNSGTDYFAWTPAVGNHSVRATPYTLANATGTAGTPLLVTFAVVDDAGAASTAEASMAEPPASGSGDGGGGCGATGVEALLLLLFRRRLRRVLLAVTVLAPLALLAATPAAALFYENAGVVSMEAEHATSGSGWASVPGLSGTAMRDNVDRGQGSMSYEIEFTQGGKYYVWLLCRHTSADGASADDCFVTVDGQKLYGSDDVTRPDGMQAAGGSFGWSSRPKGPGGTTPSNIAAGPVYALVSGPGRKVFWIGSRSKGFEVDKIVLRRDNAAAPTGTGPAETLAAGTAPPPPPATPGTGTESSTGPGGNGGSPSPNGDHTLNDTLCESRVAAAPPGGGAALLALGVAAFLFARGRRLVLLLAAAGVMAGAAPRGAVGTNVFSVSGESVLFNGQPFKVVGLRVSNALLSDADTQELIENLAGYKSYGVNTVSVYFMGSRFGDVKGYRRDATLDPTVAARMGRIIQAADDRGMIVLVGCLYWSTSRAKEDLGGWGQTQANAAVANTVRWLKDGGYRNVFVDPDNEGMSPFSISSMIDAAHAVDPAIRVAANETNTAPANADLLIHHSPKVAGKPWVQAEGAPSGYWGTYSKQTFESTGGSYYNYSRIGRYTAAMKDEILRQSRDDINNRNGYMLASTWLQCAPAQGVGGPFMRPGGRSDIANVDDTIDTLHADAGVLWWLEAMKTTYGAWTPPAGGAPPPATTPEVTSLTLMDADNDQPVAGFDLLKSGSTLNLGTLPTPNLSLRANTSPATVGSVKFGYDANANYRTENSAPYALAGDSSGNFNPWTPTVGSHSVAATAYSLSNAGGTAGAPLTVTFTVIDDPMTPSQNGPAGSSTPAAPSSGDNDNGDGCGLLGVEGPLLLALLGLCRRID